MTQIALDAQERKRRQKLSRAVQTSPETRRGRSERMKARWADPEEGEKLREKLKQARLAVVQANKGRRYELRLRRRRGHVSVLNRWLENPTPDADLRRLRGKLRMIRSLSTPADAVSDQELAWRYERFKAQVEQMRAERGEKGRLDT